MHMASGAGHQAESEAKMPCPVAGIGIPPYYHRLS